MRVWSETLSEVLGEGSNIKGILLLGINSNTIQYASGLIQSEQLMKDISLNHPNDPEKDNQNQKTILDYTFGEIGELLFYRCCDDGNKRYQAVHVLMVDGEDEVPFVMTISSTGEMYLYAVSQDQSLEYNDWLDAVNYGPSDVARYSAPCTDSDWVEILGTMEEQLSDLYIRMSDLSSVLYELRRRLRSAFTKSTNPVTDDHKGTDGDYMNLPVEIRI